MMKQYHEGIDMLVGGTRVPEFMKTFRRIGADDLVVGGHYLRFDGSLVRRIDAIKGGRIHFRDVAGPGVFDVEYFLKLHTAVAPPGIELETDDAENLPPLKSLAALGENRLEVKARNSMRDGRRLGSRRQPARLSRRLQGRVFLVAWVLREVEDRSFEEWLAWFENQPNPARRIDRWIAMARIYVSFVSGRKLTAEARREAFQIIQQFSAGEITPVWQLKHLTQLDLLDLQTLVAGAVERSLDLARSAKA